jgi:hypothetical protein
MKSAYISRELNQRLEVIATNTDITALTTGVARPAFGVVSRANRKLADSSPRGRNVQFNHLGISGGRIRANNRGVVFHP